MTEARRESYYRDLLAAQVGGRTEVLLPFGRADVMTATHVFEVEPAESYRSGIRQALQYAAQCGLQGVLASYGRGWQAEKIFTGLAVLPLPGLEFWWLDGDLFTRISSGEQARSYASPDEPPWTSTAKTGAQRSAAYRQRRDARLAELGLTLAALDARKTDLDQRLAAALAEKERLLAIQCKHPPRWVSGAHCTACDNDLPLPA